ncbi:MAG: helix-hairpin-helix domain-containing protein [Saprospiraceae bacterium]|nr:helix-hairpin-helix domain-containing protein [Saprospiraceae bacterium]
MKAQDIPLEITDQIEAFLEEQSDDVDILLLYDLLQSYTKKPLNLNRAEYEDLIELRLLTPIQINNILDHRNTYGNFIAIEELQSVPGMGIEDIKRIRNFLGVTSGPNVNLNVPQLFVQSDQDLLLRWSRVLEEKKGYIPNSNGDIPYQGDANKYLVRFAGSYETNLRYGFIAEKDAGEPFMQSAKDLGFDYLTFHAYLRDYSDKIKTIALGDYSLSLGQGLIEHNAFGAGKSAFVTNIKKGGRIIRPYSSVLENGFYRGVATTISPIENIELSVFASSTKRDGNVLLSDTIEGASSAILFSSLQESGNHRTVNEIEDKDAVDLKTIGATLKYKSKGWSLAFNNLNHYFAADLGRSNALYNLYRFQGDQLSNYSLDFSYRLRNYNFFGELAMDSGGGTAMLMGALVSLDRSFNLAVLYRSYSENYNALNPNSFGESTSFTNENGLYLGISYNLSKRWRFNAYVDIWQHPWIRFTINKPSDGIEYVARLDYFVKRKFNAYVQFLYERKLDNLSTDDIITVADNQVRHRLRWHFNTNVNKQLELRTRIEVSRFDNPLVTEWGYMVYQDIIFRSINSPLSFTTRFALFDTDGFDSRIFAFENSILYEFTIPSYFDQGFRYYVNLRYNVNYNFTAELRYSRTHNINRDDFSSGNELIDGDTKSEIKAQVLYNF